MKKKSRIRMEDLKQRFKKEFIDNSGMNLRKPKEEKPKNEMISFENIQMIFFSKLANFNQNEERMKSKKYNKKFI